MSERITRRLGRTGRQITTLGLGGQASIQWPGEGIDPVAIIEKAVRLGVTYLDTSNIYGPSQKHFGRAFRRLGLVPGAPNYDAELRGRIFLASKRTCVRRGGRDPQLFVLTSARAWATAFRSNQLLMMCEDHSVSCSETAKAGTPPAPTWTAFNFTTSIHLTKWICCSGGSTTHHRISPGWGRWRPCSIFGKAPITADATRKKRGWCVTWGFPDIGARQPTYTPFSVMHTA